jgi:hypothetical protein
MCSRITAHILRHVHGAENLAVPDRCVLAINRQRVKASAIGADGHYSSLRMFLSGIFQSSEASVKYKGIVLIHRIHRYMV